MGRAIYPWAITAGRDSWLAVSLIDIYEGIVLIWAFMTGVVDGWPKGSAFSGKGLK